MDKLRMIKMRTAAKPVAAVAGLVVAGAVLAACGGGGSSSGSTPVAAAASASSSSGAGNAAYRACLQQHGVTLPSRAPGSGRPSGAPSGGGGGGFFGGGGGGFSQSPQMQAAFQACSSLRPTGAAGFGGRGGTALVAFRNCMNQQGVAIPTTRPTAFPTASRTNSSARYLNGLDPNDPKVSAALKICQALIPTRSASPSSSPTG